MFKTKQTNQNNFEYCSTIAHTPNAVKPQFNICLGDVVAP